MAPNLSSSLISTDENLNLRLLALLGGLGLFGFELIYILLDEPTGPAWLRGGLVTLCISFFLVTQFVPNIRTWSPIGAGALAFLITAENTYRMYLVDFTMTHSLPMIIVLIGASYAFRSQLSMTLYLLTGCTGLTIAMVLTANPEISPMVYIATVWVVCILTLIVFGSRGEQHQKVLSHERLLSGIFEQSFGGLLLIENNRILLANDRARELFHSSIDDELLIRIIQVLQLHLDSKSTELSDFMVNGVLREEVRLLPGEHWPEDEELWLDVNLRRIDLEGKHLLLMSLYDITAQRNSIQSLRRSELFLEQSQRIGDLGSWDVNLITGQLLWSPEMFSIFEMNGSPQPSVEASIKLLDEASQQSCIKAFQDIERPGDRTSVMVQTTLKDNGIKHLNMIAEVIKLEGEPHLVGITQDITDEIKGKQALVAAKDAAEQALQVRGTFLANMSHEIRTPMNGVIGMTSLLLSSELSREQRDQLNTIKHSGESLLHLINDILDYAKIDAEKVELENQPFDLAEVMHGTLELLKLQADQKSIYLNLELADDLPAQLSGDAKRLEQIVINLANNAIKFTNEGGVTIKLGGTPKVQDSY